MRGKSLNSLAIILLLLGCAGSSRYIIRFPEPEKHFAEDRYYVDVNKGTNELFYDEELYFKNGTVFRTSIAYPDSSDMPIRQMAEEKRDGFVFGEDNPQLRYSYSKSYYSSWGRYTIKDDTLFLTDLGNYHESAYRLFGWKKENYKQLIRGDTLLVFHYKTVELVPDSVGYSVYNPNVKLDFMDSRKAWIYKYNEYPKVE